MLSSRAGRCASAGAGSPASTDAPVLSTPLGRTLKDSTGRLARGPNVCFVPSTHATSTPRCGCWEMLLSPSSPLPVAPLLPSLLSLRLLGWWLGAAAPCCCGAGAWRPACSPACCPSGCCSWGGPSGSTRGCQSTSRRTFPMSADCVQGEETKALADRAAPPANMKPQNARRPWQYHPAACLARIAKVLASERSPPRSLHGTIPKPAAAAAARAAGGSQSPRARPPSSSRHAASPPSSQSPGQQGGSRAGGIRVRQGHSRQASNAVQNSVPAAEPQEPQDTACRQVSNT